MTRSQSQTICIISALDLFIIPTYQQTTSNKQGVLTVFHLVWLRKSCSQFINHLWRGSTLSPAADPRKVPPKLKGSFVPSAKKKTKKKPVGFSLTPHDGVNSTYLKPALLSRKLDGRRLTARLKRSNSFKQESAVKTRQQPLITPRHRLMRREKRALAPTTNKPRDDTLTARVAAFR